MISPESPEAIIFDELPALLMSDDPHENYGAIACVDYLEDHYDPNPYLDIISDNTHKIYNYNVRRSTADNDSVSPIRRSFLISKNRRYSKYDDLYKPRVVGMFATAAFIATTEGLEDPHPIRKSLHYALKSTDKSDLRVVFIKDLIIPFCKSKIKKQVSPRVEAAFALEPFMEMQEQFMTKGSPNQLLGLSIFKPATRDDLKKLIVHCQSQEELKKFRRKNH